MVDLDLADQQTSRDLVTYHGPGLLGFRTHEFTHAVSMLGNEAVWAPSIAGYAGATMLTGVSLGQAFAYIWWFPHDKRLLRIAVLSILFSDVLQTGLSLAIAWAQFISCRRNLSYDCTIKSTWQSLVRRESCCLSITMSHLIEWAGSSSHSYANNIWRTSVLLLQGLDSSPVSGSNWIVTGLVALFALAQLSLGAICAGVLISSGKVAVLFNNPYLPSSYGASAICDIIISASMIFYLREARSGVRRSGNRMQRMVVIFVQMGMLTCLTAILVAISYVLTGPIYWESLPSELLPKLYVNSMFAVLNARKTVRDNEGESHGVKIVVPTIHLDPLNDGGIARV